MRARDAACRPPALLAASPQLDAYFRSGLRRFDLDLDRSLTGGFTERVLRALHAGVPGWASPARPAPLGAAMGANPLPIVVPCHRVVESRGGLGGFAGGVETKRALLAGGKLPEPLF